MDHVAIMSRRFGDLIAKILSGEKKIESRWLKNKSAPWGKVKTGDTIYFKKSGGPVTAVASVSKILQFDNLSSDKVRVILDKWPLIDYEWVKNKKYCVLIWLKNPKSVKPFKINKSGFGSATAWLCVGNIEKVRYW